MKNRQTHLETILGAATKPAQVAFPKIVRPWYEEHPQILLVHEWDFMVENVIILVTSIYRGQAYTRVCFVNPHELVVEVRAYCGEVRKGRRRRWSGRGGERADERGDEGVTPPRRPLGPNESYTQSRRTTSEFIKGRTDEINGLQTDT